MKTTLIKKEWTEQFNKAKELQIINIKGKESLIRKIPNKKFREFIIYHLPK